MTTIDANAATDSEVADALGIESEEETTEEVGQDEESEEQDEVGAELEKLRKENARLRRESAERRLREKRAAKANKASESGNDIEAAREAGREEARAEHGIELTEARIRAALTGVVPDERLDEFVEDLNISRYVGDDHKPDLEAIAALKDRQASLLGMRKTTKVSHGRQGGGASKKSNADQFADVFAGLLKS